MSEFVWNPIEEAPKRGVLLLMSEAGEVRSGRYSLGHGKGDWLEGTKGERMEGFVPRWFARVPPKPDPLADAYEDLETAFGIPQAKILSRYLELKIPALRGRPAR